MSDDYRVDGRSNAKVRACGKRARQFLGLSEKTFIEVLELEAVTEIWTVLGPKPFRFEAVSDTEIRGDFGRTTFDESAILVQVPRRIRHDALLGHGYARFTIAHELGHGTLHVRQLLQGASMPRRQLGNFTPGWIQKFESAEHQAMVFAAAFLINDDIARSQTCADDIAVQFGLSLDAARIYFDQMLEEMERPSSVERVQLMAAEFKASAVQMTSAKRSIQFLNDACASCGQRKVFPVGHKFMCQACNTISDGFQDGDSVQ